MRPQNRRKEFLKDGPLLTYYEKVLIEALKLAQIDADRGLLDNDRMIRVRDVVAEIVDDLSAHEDEISPRPALDAGAKEGAPLAHIDLAEESLVRNAQEIPIHWSTGKPVL